MRILGLLLATTLLTLNLNAEASAEVSRYTVQAGDTLIGIRERLLRPDISWQALQRLNRVPDPLRLRPGSQLQWPNSWLRERPVQAQLLHIQGAVQVLRGAESVQVQVGDWLREDDRLLSGADGSAQLQFVDGSRSRLRPSSELRLNRLRQEGSGARTQLGLQSGAVDSKVTPASNSKRKSASSFEVQTPVAQLGVRGTEFRSRMEDGNTLLEVLEGQVQAKHGKSKPAAVAAGLGWRSDRSGVQPLPQAPQLDGFKAPLERLPITLQWPALAGVSAWRLQVEGADGRVHIDSLLDQAHWQGGAELPDGDFLIRLRARNIQGFEGPDAEQVLQLRARPEPPLLQSPAAQAEEVAESVRFAWTRAPEAARYHWQLASSADFAQVAQDESAVASTELLTKLGLGQHFWRVASVRANGQRGPWSEAQTLTRVAPPPPPAAPLPASRQDDGKHLALRWAASSLAGARYEIQVSRQPDFSQNWFESQLDAPEVKLEPQQSGPHYVRIRTLAADGRSGPWGGTQAFEWSTTRWWWWLAPLLLFAL